MGYSLYIHRRENWFDEGEDLSISYDEWNALAAADEALDVVGFSENLHTNIIHESFEMIDPIGNKVVFHWSAGAIEIEGASEASVPKIFRSISKLDAKLQGDDGEFYREDGTSFYPEVTEADVSPSPIHRQKPRSFFSKLLKR